MGRIRKNRKGFTLIELIVAIGIMLILAAVATPFLLTHIKNAKVSNLNEQILNVKSAFDSWYTAKGGLLPESDDDEANPTGNHLDDMVTDGWLSSDPSGKNNLNWYVRRFKDEDQGSYYIDVIEVVSDNSDGRDYLADIVGQLDEIIDGTDNGTEGVFRYCTADSVAKFRFMLRKDSSYADNWDPSCS